MFIIIIRGGIKEKREKEEKDQQLIYSCSGLESAHKISEGKREVPHFDSKAEVQGTPPSPAPFPLALFLFTLSPPPTSTHNMIEHLEKSGVPYTIVQPASYFEVSLPFPFFLSFY